jgi:hypothetical protein
MCISLGDLLFFLAEQRLLKQVAFRKLGVQNVFVTAYTAKRIDPDAAFIEPLDGLLNPRMVVVFDWHKDTPRSTLQTSASNPDARGATASEAFVF